MADSSGAARLIQIVQSLAKDVQPDGIRLQTLEEDGIVWYDGVKLDPSDYVNLTKSPMKKGDNIAVYKERGEPGDADDDQYIVIGESTEQEAPALGSITNSWLEDNLQED